MYTDLNLGILNEKFAFFKEILINVQRDRGIGPLLSLHKVNSKSVGKSGERGSFPSVLSVVERRLPWSWLNPQQSEPIVPIFTCQAIAYFV
jgi:hypothetical protein